MCPSWGGRGAGEARDKAGLAYTLMGRADAGKEVPVNMHIHPTPVRRLPLKAAIDREVKVKVHEAHYLQPPNT